MMRSCAVALLLLCGCPGSKAQTGPAEQPAGATAQTGSADALRVLETSPPETKPSSDFAGTFSDGTLTLELEETAEGLRGTFAVRGQLPFPALCTVDGDRLNGTFEAKGKAFPFHGTWRDGGLDLTCDGRDYRLVVHDSSVAALSEPAAAGVAAVGSDSFVGRFVGTLNGSRATLTLEASADGVAGTARDANAYRYSVRGTYAGDRVHGEWTDPGLGKSLPFELEASADGVVLTFASEPPVSLPFRRSDDAGPAPSTTLDPALLGTWIRNADDERRITLELRADGTYTYGHSRSASPGSAVTGSTATGQLIAGRWRSGEGALLTSVRGQSEFAHFAAYELAQERLVLIFEGTGAEVWRRP